MIEFFLSDVVQDRHGPIVCGRCGEGDFGVGDVFVFLCWIYGERDEGSKEWVELDEGNAADVRLRVEEIGYYDGTIERLPYGRHPIQRRWPGEPARDRL